jgi:hypothetical protein
VTTSFEGTTGPPATTFITGEKIVITAKANAVFMVVLLIDTKDNYPQLIRLFLGTISQMLSLLLSLVRSYGTKVLHLFTGLEL